MAQTTWILQLCYPWGTTLRVPPLGRQWHTRTSGLPGRFRWSHGGGRLLVACLFRGETGEGSLAGWVLRHTVRTLLARFVTGETVVGSARGCQGETPVNAEEMSMAIDALIGGGVQAAAHRPWSCGSAHPARSTERLLITITPGGSSAAFCPSRPHITVDHMRALLGPGAHHIVKYWVSD